MTLFESTVRPVLFRVGGGDAERAHEFTLRRLTRLGERSLAVLRRRYAVSRPGWARIDGPRDRLGLGAAMSLVGTLLALF